MKVVAIVAEYNPFHNGHAYQIEQIKRMLPDCIIIAVMSGSLVQRGEFALISKYERAKAAVLCGVDAVFELPSVYSCAPANLFAGAAVNIIENLSGINFICFGSESGDLQLLEFAAEKSESDEFNAQLRENIKSDKNKNYPSNFYGTFKNLYGEEKAEVFKGSNDILGVEYLRALKKNEKNEYKVLPLVIKRTGDNYITSASSIRACVKENHFENLQNYMPEKSFALLAELIKSGKTADIDNISSAIISHINRLTLKETARFAEIYGGFEHKIKKTCRNSFDYQNLIKSLESKHITGSQIKRMVLNIFFEITREEQKEMPSFTNLLCANKIGREYLNKIRKQTGIKIIVKPSSFTDVNISKNIFIDNIYKLALYNKSGEKDAIKEKPVIL